MSASAMATSSCICSRDSAMTESSGADAGLGEVAFIHGDKGLGLLDGGLRAGAGGASAGSGGDGGIHVGLGGHLAAADALKLLLACKGSLSLGDGGLGLLHGSLGGGDGGAVVADLLLEFAGIEAGEWLSLGHAVVSIDKNLQGGAGELAADGDLVGRLQIAGGRDGEGDVAAGDGGGDVGGGTAGGVGTTAATVGDAKHEHTGGKGEVEFAARVQAGGTGAHDGVEVGRLGGRRRVNVNWKIGFLRENQPPP